MNTDWINWLATLQKTSQGAFVIAVFLLALYAIEKLRHIAEMNRIKEDKERDKGNE